MGTPSITDPKGKTFVAENGSFLEKEFLSKEVSGRKVELDEVTVVGVLGMGVPRLACLRPAAWLK